MDGLLLAMDCARVCCWTEEAHGLLPTGAGRAAVWTAVDTHYVNLDQCDHENTRRHIYDAMQACWRAGVVKTLQAIWRRRCLYRDPREDCSVDRAAAVLHGRLRNTYITIRALTGEITRNSHCITAAAIVCKLLLQPSPETAQLPSPTRRLQHHLLLFDGGSRGDPGLGGSGSAIIRFGGNTRTPEIVWMASVSYVRRITNNAAEYHGLLIGLRQALRMKMVGVHVAGDSHLILTQLRCRRSPQASHLRGAYVQCRNLADQLMVPTWTHHVREFNKLADLLANIAMDSKKSLQICASDLTMLDSRWTKVPEFLKGDIEHWIDLHSDMEGDGRTSVNTGQP